MEIYSCSILPLSQVTKRYKLDQERLFSIVLNFLSHRREEILNAELSRWFGPSDASIKREIKPILYQLMNELDISDNVEDYYFRNQRFYIKDRTNGSFESE